MIVIRKNEINRVALEFPQLESDDTYFMFAFKYEGITEDYYMYMTASDISSAANRYSLFEIEEGVDVQLEIGQWNYGVWVSKEDWGTFSNPNSIPPAKVSGSIQQGRLLVRDLSGGSTYSGVVQSPEDENSVYK